MFSEFCFFLNRVVHVLLNKPLIRYNRLSLLMIQIYFYKYKCVFYCISSKEIICCVTFFWVLQTYSNQNRKTDVVVIYQRVKSYR